MKKLILPSLLLAALLAACSPANPASSPSAGATGGSASNSPLDQAKLKAAQYDYAGAADALKGQTSDEAKQLLNKIQSDQAAAVAWTTPEKTSHIFYHSLIVDPKRAFNPANKDYAGWCQWMVTQSEFEKQLQQIYDKGYVLVLPERLYKLDDAGKMVKADPIKLPQGKKPLVFSADDINYYSRQDDFGFANGLKFAADGKIVNTYKDASGATLEGAYDVPTVLDEFVRQHPDFSYRGDKGMIALTGYEGALGFHSSVSVYGDTPATKQAQADAKKMADAFKAEGWEFASHTWNHISMQPTAMSLDAVKADMTKWMNEVGPIVGKTNLMIFAFGSDVGPLAANYKPYDNTNPRFTYLHDELGFRYFFPIDSSVPYWTQTGSDWFRQSRIDIDGITMQRAIDGKKTAITDFIDAKGTADPLRPNPIPTVNTGVK